MKRSFYHLSRLFGKLASICGWAGAIASGPKAMARRYGRRIAHKGLAKMMRGRK